MNDEIKKTIGYLEEMFGGVVRQEKEAVEDALTELYEYAFWAGYREASRDVSDILESKKAP